MKRRITKARLRRLVAKWNKRSREYQAERSVAHSNNGRNRYEGIATGSRWAAEDLEKLL